MSAVSDKVYYTGDEPDNFMQARREGGGGCDGCARMVTLTLPFSKIVKLSSLFAKKNRLVEVQKYLKYPSQTSLRQPNSPPLATCAFGFIFVVRHLVGSHLP